MEKHSDTKKRRPGFPDGVFAEWVPGYLPFLAGALAVGTVEIV